MLVAVLAVAACGTTKEITDLNGQQVYFAFDSAHISEQAKDNLLAQSLYLKDHTDVNIVIEGNCDERGSTDYNLALGSLRAGNAAHVLIADGIEPVRIKTISYGKERPQYKGSGESVWKLNRNATTRVME